MAIPKTKVLQDRESAGVDATMESASALVERSNRVTGVVADKTSLPAVSVFNDYVAVLLTPRESTIALPGKSEYSNVGVIVGIGPLCVNKFALGQNVVINPRGGAIVIVEEQGSAYDGKIVNLYQEKNIFYAAKTGPSVTVQ